MVPINSRFLLDGSFISNTNVPASNANAISAVFDLIQSYAASERYNVKISVPALPNNTVTASSVSVQLQHSSNGANAASFSNIPECAPFIVPGVTSTGSIATVDNYKLPPSCLEFIQAKVYNTNVANSTSVPVQVALTF